MAVRMFDNKRGTYSVVAYVGRLQFASEVMDLLEQQTPFIPQLVQAIPSQSIRVVVKSSSTANKSYS